MLNLKRLLKFSPTDAIFMMANSSLNTQLRPEIATVGEPVSLGGRRTRIGIFSTSHKPRMVQNPYTGNTVLEYNRYDLGDVFDQILLDITPPTTVKSILDEIVEKTGIVFDDQDFENERVDSSTYILKAAVSSKRWVGEVSVTLGADIIGVHISQWLTTNYHDGLVVGDVDYIWDHFPNDILDGLQRGTPSMGVYLRNTDHGGLFKVNLPSIGTILTQKDHDGLVKDRLAAMVQYLPVVSHGGLVTEPKPPIYETLPNTDHSGLLMYVERYLDNTSHDGLTSPIVDSPPPPIDGYSL